MCDHCRPLPDIVDLDQRRESLAIDEGELVIDVVLLVKDR